MELSARNQLKGRVKSIKVGGIMAEVLVDVGGQEVVAVITRGSGEGVNIQEGDPVTVVIKSTEVMLAKEGRPAGPPTLTGPLKFLFT